MNPREDGDAAGLGLKVPEGYCSGGLDMYEASQFKGNISFFATGKAVKQRSSEMCDLWACK